MFNIFFSFSVSEAGFNLEDKTTLRNVSRLGVIGYRGPKENPTRTLDAGNASRGGRLLSRLLGLVGLEHSDGLVHLEQRITS